MAEKLGLEDEPYAKVIHEKNGRRHAHAVWSRIDLEKMTTINLPYFKTKLRDVSKELFLDHGWDLPKGLQSYGAKDPLDYSLAEWQQLQRADVDPKEMKQLFVGAWTHSDDGKSIKAAVADKGLYLAKGDRRGFVALDMEGTVYSLSRWCGVKAKDVKTLIGNAVDLQSVADVNAWLRSNKTKQVHDYINQIKDQHRKDMQPWMQDRAQMVLAQRQEWAMSKTKQEHCWMEEIKTRSERLRRACVACLID